MVAGIVGLGLMGGSMGLALKALEQIEHVVGYDHNPTNSHEAIERRLVDAIVDWETLLKSDVIFLAIPVEGIIKVIQSIDTLPEHTTIIDLGSTKAKIAEKIPPHLRSNIILSHPMTGTERFGPSAALPDLYQDKIVVLCNIEESGEHQRYIARELFSAIGMKIVTMDAHDHDRHAAYISHLPHAISYALANTVMNQEDAHNILILAAGGFRDMSRLAKSSPIMWEEIFKQNRDHLLEAMDRFEEELTLCRHLINQEDWGALHNWMAEAQKLHDIL